MTSDKVYINFKDYVNNIAGFLTNKSKEFFIDFQWISPIRLQVIDIYYIAADGEAKFLKKFLNTKRYMFKTDDLGIKSIPGTDLIFSFVIQPLSP